MFLFAVRSAHSFHSMPACPGTHFIRILFGYLMHKSLMYEIGEFAFFIFCKASMLDRLSEQMTMTYFDSINKNRNLAIKRVYLEKLIIKKLKSWCGFRGNGRYILKFEWCGLVRYDFTFLCAKNKHKWWSYIQTFKVPLC